MIGASLNEVTRWSWQIWQEACEKMILHGAWEVVFLQNQACLSFILETEMFFPESACEGFFVKKQPL